MYWDTTRQPECYQSYPAFAGQNDRYYDDNDWVAIDFCDYYAVTKNKEYLKKAIALHDYIYSGWSDELGGGIYWCEQKKESKNTCSNAPATVKGEMKFFPSSPWFNVILFRGLKALYEVDKNDTYVKAMIDNADYAWQYTRDENGLLNNDWSGNRKDKFKSLLENSCMIELYSEISEL